MERERNEEKLATLTFLHFFFFDIFAECCTFASVFTRQRINNNKFNT